MAKFKVNKTRDYTIIPNIHLKERKMSLKSKGLLTLMLSLPDDWNYSLKGLVSLCSESESAVKSSLQELKEFGYLRIQKLAPKKGNGKFEYIYEIFESPLKKEERQRVNKKAENLQLENQPDENVTIENLKVENQPVENLQLENQPDENVTIENLKVENQPVENLQLENQPDILITKQSRTKELNTKEKNKKEKTDHTEKLFEYIESLKIDAEKKKIFKEWVGYKKSKGQYKDTKSLDVLIRRFIKYSVEELRNIVEKSIMNNYAGIFEPKEGVNNGNSYNTRYSRKQEDRHSKKPDYTKGFDDWN